MELQADLMASQSFCKQKAVCNRNIAVRCRMPQKGFWRMAADLMFQRNQAAKVFIIGMCSQQILEGALMAVSAGGDDRITENHTVRTDFIGLFI